MSGRSEVAARTVAKAEEVERSAELIEALLASPDRRRRFRADPHTVLREHGVAEPAAGLGEGRAALMTLELRESRSSLAGVMVAAAAEGIELGHLLEHAAPALGHDVGRAMEKLTDNAHAPVRAHPARHPASAHPPAAHPAQTQPAVAPQPQPQREPGPQPQPQREPGSGGTVTGPIQHGGPGELPIGRPAGHDPALEYPGDGASPQQLAAWMGARARWAGLPPELPVMAALTESTLHNLHYGDRDSVGFFQMRLGIWDRGAYAGYPDHPEVQMQWFIDHALEARAADPALGASPGTWGEWVANIEQPAAIYRGRYQLQLGAAQELLRGTGAGSAPLSAAPVTHVPAGRAAVNVAMKYLTTAHWGASVPDGAALVQYAYDQEGIHLPGVAAELLDVGAPVARHALRPGDAVFFAQDDGGHRVGLYIGDGHVAAIPRHGGRAEVLSLADQPAAGEYAAARRYTAASLSDPSTFARTLPTVSR